MSLQHGTASGVLACLLVGSLAAAPALDVQVVKAGTIHTVDASGVIENGAILIEDGRILRVGTDIEVPPGATVIDYGASAVIVPGLIAADSSLAEGAPAERTAAPDLLALDGFDFYATFTESLGSGVTSAYITPARGRLIAGQGAVVKLGGDDPDARVLKAGATVHGAVDDSARRTPGYWTPPIPATVDVGLGIPEEQLPRSTMGAVLALNELLDGVASGERLDAYGPRAVRDLAALLKGGAVWRLDADMPQEISALADLAERRSMTLVISGATYAGDLAERLAELNIGVVYQPPMGPASFGSDNIGPDGKLPPVDTAARLAKAGVVLAIAPAPGAGLDDLRFSAALARRGGLSREDALEALTLGPATLYGVADKVGSLRAGKHADLVVFNGDPLDVSSGVLATYIDGEVVWSPEMSLGTAELGPGATLAGGERGAANRAKSMASRPATPVVLSVDHLYLGDGDVLSPGEVLLRNGRVAEVGTQVSRPGGARVIHAPAAMPGIIDCLGHLGLEGSRRMPSTDFDLTRIVEAGDDGDRAVAKAGVTTVVMTPRGESSSGAPMMAYRPASADPDSSVVDGLAALRLVWPDSDRSKSGARVRDLLEKAAKYDAEFAEYEQAMASWSPEPEVPNLTLPGADEEEDADEEEEDEDDDADDDKKKKKKKSKDLDPDPVTGIWLANFDFDGAEVGMDGAAQVPEDDDDEEADDDEEDDDKEGDDKEGDDDDEEEDSDEDSDDEDSDESEPLGTESLRMQIRLNADGSVEGFLRSAALSGELVAVSGSYESEEGEKQAKLALSGAPLDGEPFTFEGVIEDATVSAEAVVFTGTLAQGERSAEVSARRDSREYPMAQRPGPVVADEDDEQDSKSKSKDKDKPKEPRLDSKLEPFRRAMRGEVAILVKVDRADEILDCVAAFEGLGIQPVLLSASQAPGIAGQLTGRVRGILLDNSVLRPGDGLASDSPLARLQSAGIPVGFHSGAEEGAAYLPLMAAYAVRHGMSPTGALRALTADAAAIMAIDDLVGTLARGMSGDVVLLDGNPLDPASSVLHVFVAGREVH